MPQIILRFQRTRLNRRGSNMKLRLIATTALAAVCLSSPAFAAEGWYLGIGAGWDHQAGIHVQTTTPPIQTARLNSDDGALFVGSLGYGWESGLRLEWEEAYTSHDFTTLVDSAGVSK